MEKRGGEIDALTGLRAVGALLVLLFHLTKIKEGLYLDFWVLDPIIKHGDYGVDIFFVLSGFVLCIAYGAKLGASWNLTAVRDFFGRRFARIYPLHLATMLFMIILAVLAKPLLNLDQLNSPNFSWQSIAASLVMFNASHVSLSSPNSVAWSVSSEWMAYLCFPFLFLVGHRSKTASLAFFAAALAVGYGLFTVFVSSHDYWKIAFEFPLGMIAGLMFDGLSLKKHVLLVLQAFAIAGLLCAFYFAPLKSQYIVGASSALLIVGLAHQQVGLAKPLASKPMKWLGAISYSIYLVHWPVWSIWRDGALHLGWGLGIQSYWFMLLPAMLSIIVASLSFRYVEEPCRKAWMRRSEARAKRSALAIVQHDNRPSDKDEEIILR